jgi:hypothetical protein
MERTGQCARLSRRYRPPGDDYPPWRMRTSGRKHSVDVIPQTSMRRRTRHGIIRCFRSWRRVTSCMQKGEWDMRSIRDLIAEGASHYDQSDAEGMTAIYADDAVVTAPPGSRAEGKQAILDYLADMVRALSDKRGEVGRSSETGNTYFGEITFWGTNTGDLTMPDGTSIPATGKPLEVRGVEFARCATARSSSTTCTGTVWT